MVVPSSLSCERVCWRAGREGAFSRGSPCWIVTYPRARTESGCKKVEQVREQEEHDGAIDPRWEDVS